MTADREIPVIFHVIHSSDGTGLHADSTLHLAVDSLNSAFEPSGDGNNAQITFKLAGISRIQNDVWFSDLMDSDEEFTDMLSVDTWRVMNVFVGDIIGYAGYVYGWAVPGNPRDAVFLDYQYLPGFHPWNPNPTQGGDVIIHEVGHWLKLLHTFSPSDGEDDPVGCEGGDTLPGCLMMGDGVCDTAAEETPASGCPIGRDTCPTGGPDPIHNHLDYSSSFCRREFTPGQFERMRDAILTIRPPLGVEPVLLDRDLVVGAGETWDWLDIDFRFEQGYGIEVYGAMSTGFVTLAADDPMEGWAGVEVFDGGSLTVTGSTSIDDTEVTVDGLFSVAEDSDLALNGTTLRFAQGQRLVSYGEVHADGALFTERTQGQGWRGIYLGFNAMGPPGPPPVSTFENTDIYYASLPPGAQIATAAAVEVHDTVLILDNSSSIRNSGSGVGGLLVSGPNAVVAVDFSYIIENAGPGVLAMAGATVAMTGGSNVEQSPSGGGVVAAGYGTTVTLDKVSILDNGGVGVRATYDAEILFVEQTSTDRRVRAFRNAGGLEAGTGGFVAAGTCPELVASSCPDPVHRIEDNADGGFFDAKSLDGSVLYAQGNFWGLDVQDVSDLVLIDDYPASILDVVPIVTSPSLRLPGSSASSVTASGLVAGTDGDFRGGGNPVLAHVDAAERAYLDDDAPQALSRAVDAVVAVLAPSAPETERRAAFEAAARLLAWEQPPQALTTLARQAALPGPSRPWALRALTVAHAEAGRLTEARAAAASLVADYGGSEHARFGLALPVRLAVEERDEEGALAALEALITAFPDEEETAHASALVRMAFPEVSVPEGRVAGGSDTAAASAASVVEEGPALRVEAVRPNPATALAVVPFVLGEEAAVQVSLYDVLGRRLSVLARRRYGAGRHAVSLDAADLPPGVYVVRLVAQPSSGPAAVAARRLTLAR